MHANTLLHASTLPPIGNIISSANSQQGYALMWGCDHGLIDIADLPAHADELEYTLTDEERRQVAAVLDRSGALAGYLEDLQSKARLEIPRCPWWCEQEHPKISVTEVAAGSFIHHRVGIVTWVPDHEAADAEGRNRDQEIDVVVEANEIEGKLGELYISADLDLGDAELTGRAARALADALVMAADRIRDIHAVDRADAALSS